MIYCTECGSGLQDKAQFCQSCGTAVLPGVEPSAQHEAEFGSTASTGNETDTSKGMAILSYILFFIPLLTGDHKKSPFVKFHANQGTILFIATVAITVATNILLTILRAIFFNIHTWGIFSIFSTVLNAIWILPVVLAVIGIMNASNGREKHLPIIGDRFTIIK
ncbi:MAG: zinc-ribbon domain-containing protein [Oscillospiraceae bacterium]|nr:zinc-ribbon domain-containing protein [Oscillospiraceae bacterium]MCL2278677.1 zinc-ribbon domain-containing protein [Oscillospiraceae bacterium]